jgi:hypothetical protein
MEGLVLPAFAFHGYDVVRWTDIQTASHPYRALLLGVGIGVEMLMSNRSEVTDQMPTELIQTGVKY